MRGYKPKKRHKFPLVSMLHFVCVVIAIFLTQVFSQPVSAMGSTYEVSVDKRTFLREVNGATNVITQTSEGGFIVAGVAAVGWAAGIASTGQILWMYKDVPDHPTATFKSNFRGAVQLANGNVLICGSQETPRQNGVLVVLDRSGKLLERRVGFANDGDALPDSGFFHCLHWDDGIALVGYAAKGLQGSPKIARLNAQGDTVWEKSIAGLPTGDVVETLDHGLVLSTFSSKTFEIELAKISLSGNLVAQKFIKGSGYFHLHPVKLSNTTQIVSYGAETDLTLHTLNDRLEETEKTVNIGSFDSQQGRGVVLLDNSLALFGRSTAAAVAWISSSGKLLAFQGFDSEYKSYAIADSVQISNDQFVSVQDSVNQNRGLVLTWLSFKKH